MMSKVLNEDAPDRWMKFCAMEQKIETATYTRAE